MRIQHNIMAMSAYRNYTNNVSAMKKNLEKLSSGYKINRAGDDAAGLAISEKMRAQITGLETAQKNAKDGISLVQTAEGALTEVHDMLNRMVELASMSANGTYDDTTDRKQLQKEMDQLTSEIDRIADSANFNGIKLLDGTMDGRDITTAGDIKAALAQVGDILGTHTVLHVDPGKAKNTQFSVDLHNLSFPNKAGEDLEIKFGDNTITLKGGAEAAETKATQSGFTKAKAELKIGDLSYDVSSVKDQTDKKALAKAWIDAYNTDKGVETGHRASLDIGGDGSVKIKFVATTPGRMTVDPFGDNLGVTSGKPNGKPVTGTDAANVFGTTPTVIGTDGSFADYDAGTNDPTSKDKLLNDNVVMDAPTALQSSGANVDFTKDTTSAVLDGKSFTYAFKSSGTSGVDLGSFKVTFTTDANADTSDGKTVIVGDHLTLDNVADKVAAAVNKQIELANAKGAEGAANYVKLDVTATATGKADGTITLDANSVTATTQVYTAPTTAVYTMKNDVLKSTDTNQELTPAKLTVGGQEYEVTGSTLEEQLEDAVKQFNGDTTNNDGWTAKVDGQKVVFTKAGKQYDAPDGAAINEGEAWDASAILTAIKNGQAQLNGKDLTDLSEVEITGGNGEKGKFAIEVDNNAGTIKFTQSAKDPTEVTGNMEVRVKVGATQVAKGEHGDYNWSTTDVSNRGGSIVERLASTKFELTKDMLSDKSSVTIGKETYTFTTQAPKDGETAAKNTVYVGDLDLSKEEDLVKAATRLTEAAEGNSTYTVGNGGADKTNVITVTEVPKQEDFDLSKIEGIYESLGFSVVTPAGDGRSALTLQIGDTADSWNQLKVNIQDMHADALGIGKDQISIANQDDAATAIDVIKNAINQVSDVRGTLGATQNRLDHTINNLSVMTENIQDAESTIRDTDVASEMMAYTKNNILIQSAQAMLAQANQVPQGVLQLLQ